MLTASTFAIAAACVGPVFAFPPGITQRIAMNAAQWGDGLACGLCIAYRSVHWA